MELSKNLSRVFNFILPWSDFLYILQQEEYNTRRYLKWLLKFFWRRNIQIRDRLKYTARAKLIFVASVGLWLISLRGIWFYLQTREQVLLLFVWLILIPLFVLAGNTLVLPVHKIVRVRAVNRAENKVAKQKSLKIIGIAGSFGKTTTKNFIYELVRYNFRTQMLPGNVNTTLGIAAWIENSLQPATELLIVEMDAYDEGEIKASCKVAPPDIAIIMNVGDQHLERFRSKVKLAKTLKEIFLYAKPNAALFSTRETYNLVGPIPAPERWFAVGDKITYLSPADLPQLSDSNYTNAVFAATVAEFLNIPQKFIVDTLKKVEPPERRQKISLVYGYECIDDSYNISFTTAQAGINTASSLAREKNKKLLVVMAGIPELGPEESDKNIVLGEILGTKADQTAILKSKFASDLIQGIKNRQKYTLFGNLSEFIENAPKKFPPQEWVLLLEPELTDLYY